MSQSSKRAQATQFSPIRMLEPLADQAHQRGVKIYHLNIGQPDIPTPEVFLNGMRMIPPVLAYSPSQGLDEARQALAGYYEDRDINISPAQIVITTGGSEAIIFSLLAVADPGDAILIPEPYYANYNAYATMAGVRIIPIESRPESGFHLPDRAAIEGLITPRTRAILICNPGNPTGTVYRPDELELLAELARQHDLFLISDEVYREFVYDGLSHTSVLQLANLAQQAILVDSISKRFSACGARIGALLSRNPDIMQSVLKFAQARLSPPTLGQLGLIALLRTGDYHRQVEQIIEKFGRRRDRLYAELQRIPGVRCAKPQGAFYVIAGLPVDSAELFCRWLLAEFELDGETVMLAPAAAFYHTPGKGQDEVRLAYVLDEEALGRALQIVRAGLAAYPGRS